MTVGDIIKNKKTGKLGKVVYVGGNERKYIKYHLMGTPKNIHCSLNLDGFDIIQSLEEHYLGKGGRKIMSIPLLTWLSGNIVNDILHLQGDTLYYSYNTKATVGNLAEISISKLEYNAKNYMLSRGYMININTVPRTSWVDITATITNTDDWSYTVYQNKEYKAIFALAEVIFRKEFPFLRRRQHQKLPNFPLPKE